MEVCEETSLGLLYEVLDPCLQAKPFELTADQFVAGHHGFHIVSPIGANQGATTSFLWLVAVNRRGYNWLIETKHTQSIEALYSRFGILFGLVVWWQNGIVGNVDVDHVAYFQLLGWKLVHLK